MYSIPDIKQALRHPRNIPREFNRWYHTRFRTRDYNPDAPNVFDEDWDTLVLLDACRYDAFEEVLDEFDLSGELQEGYSRGGATMEFLAANFPNRDLSDTVYVTGTSMLYRMTVLEERFEHNLHAVVDVWEDAQLEGGNASAEQMVEATLQAREEYPNKRVFAHFVQPHIPFIGEFGSETFGDVEGSVWRQQRRGNLGTTDEDLWRAYMENLRIVVPEVKRLIKKLEGRTVVTADHGQLIGEREFPIPIKDYGHPNGIYIGELVKVPWFVNERGDRPTIVPEPSEETYDEKDRENLDQRAEDLLEDLGYV